MIDWWANKAAFDKAMEACNRAVYFTPLCQESKERKRQRVKQHEAKDRQPSHNEEQWRRTQDDRTASQHITTKGRVRRIKDLAAKTKQSNNAKGRRQ